MWNIPERNAGGKLAVKKDYSPLVKVARLLMTAENVNADLPLLGFCIEPLLGSKYDGECQSQRVFQFGYR